MLVHEKSAFHTYFHNIPKHLMSMHALSILHNGTRNSTSFLAKMRDSSHSLSLFRSPSLLINKRNQQNKKERNDEKAPNLWNYEKVARTAANVIGMRFDEKSRGFLVVCVCVFICSFAEMYGQGKLVRNFWSPFNLAFVSIGEKCLCCRLQFS